MQIDWQDAPDVKQRVRYLIKKGKIDWIFSGSVFSYRSQHAQTRAVARIWGLSRIWQQALKIKPSYIIEVIGEKYDRLSQDKKDKVLLHEIAHIPKNFSGSLVPHFRRGKRNFKSKVDSLINRYLS